MGRTHIILRIRRLVKLLSIYLFEFCRNEKRSFIAAVFQTKHWAKLVKLFNSKLPLYLWFSFDYQQLTVLVIGVFFALINDDEMFVWLIINSLNSQTIASISSSLLRVSSRHCEVPTKETGSSKGDVCSEWTRTWHKHTLPFSPRSISLTVLQSVFFSSSKFILLTNCLGRPYFVTFSLVASNPVSNWFQKESSANEGSRVRVWTNATGSSECSSSEALKWQRWPLPC